MEQIGILENKVYESEFFFQWSFRRVVFNKSYCSPFRTLSQKEFFGCHLAIVPDGIHKVVQFFLFLVGHEKQRDGQKMTCNVCLQDAEWTEYRVSSSDICLDFQPAIKLFEIHSSHPIFCNCHEYIFKLQFELISSSSIPKNVRDLKGLDNNSLKKSEYPEELIQDLRSLLISGDMHDLKICIDEETLCAHKSILCARSTVFKKMMEHECLETTSKRITITDCSVSLFQKFLEYLYTGELADRSIDTVMSLYSLSDKYDVPALRNICSGILQSILVLNSVEDISNIACDVLRLADYHNDMKLKDSSSNFIVDNFPTICDKESWKDLMKNNSKLASEILALVASRLHKKVY